MQIKIVDVLSYVTCENKMLVEFLLYSPWLSLSLSATCCLILWYYFCIMLPFSRLPSAHIEIPLLKLFFSRKSLTLHSFEIFTSLAKKYMSEGICVLWLFQPIVLIFNEEDLKNVINSSVNKADNYVILKELFGKGLLRSEREAWKKRRKLFNPVFRMSMIKDNVSSFNKYSRRLVQELKNASTSSFFEHEKYMKNFSFDVICEAILGINPEESTSERDTFIELIDVSTQFVVAKLAQPWLYFMRLFPSGRMHLQRIQKINEIAKKHLMAMKQSVLTRINSEKTSESESENRTSNKSFAEILLECHFQDPEFTIEDMVNEIKTFIFGGYDTVSYALNWGLFLLGQYPEVQDRIYEEIKSLGDELTFDDLQNMTYMECVIMEILRLCPSVPFIGRKLEKDTQLGNSLIPKGTTIGIFIYMHHRNPNIFPNPDQFHPGRYLDGDLLKSPWSHIALSAGIRNCIGQKFGILELKTALAYIIRTFRISSKNTLKNISVKWEIVLKSEEPLEIELILR